MQAEIPPSYWALISFLGLLVQVAISGLLALLFMLLQRHGGRRSHFFVLWGRAWMFLTAALVILGIGFTGLPHLPHIGDARSGWWYPLSYFSYQAGKLGYLLLLIAGVFEYAGRRLRLDFLQRGALLVVAYTLLSFVLARDIVQLLLWQTPAMIGVNAYAAWYLRRLPAARRTLGVRVSSATLAATAILWCLYGAALLIELKQTPASLSTFSAMFANFNSFYDAFLEMMLAFGMVLILLEDARREASAAHVELAVAHEKLLRESLTDSLTGVYNRLAFTRGTLLKTVGAASGAVVVFDLDNLKRVNDNHGHEAGDELLRHFVTVLRGGLRPADQLYRWGGDEFLLLMPGASCASVAQRLKDLLYRAPPLVLYDGGVTLKQEVSMGGADYADLESLREAVNLADRAMYEQKRIHKTAPQGEAKPGIGDVPA